MFYNFKSDELIQDLYIECLCPIISDVEDEYYNLHRYETLAIYAPSYIAKEILGRILENDKENDEPEFWVHEDSDVFLLYNDYEEVVITIGYDGMISVESARTNDGRILRSESVLSYVYDELPQKDVKKISNDEFSVLVFGFKDECEDTESYDKECCENCHGCEEYCAECDVCGCEDCHYDDTNDDCKELVKSKDEDKTDVAVKSEEQFFVNEKSVSKDEYEYYKKVFDDKMTEMFKEFWSNRLFNEISNWKIW